MVRKRSSSWVYQNNATVTKQRNNDRDDEEALFTKKMTRTPDYYGYFTFTSAPLKNFDFSLSGVYTGEMQVPHMAGYIEKSRMETSPDFITVNLN